MGLNKETRDFFTNKINKVLDKKLSALLENINEEKVEKACLEIFCAKAGISLNIFNRLDEAREKKDQADQEIDKIKNELADAVNKVRGNDNCSHWHSVDAASETANKKFREKVLSELYPNLLPQIQKIERIREDVQGTVLLATTEPKLLNTLNKLLQNYGGDITELLDILPKE